MTGRFGLTLFVGTALLLLGGLFHAHSKDWSNAVEVDAYCYEAKSIKDVSQALEIGGILMARALALHHLETGECVESPTRFLATTIVEDWSNGALVSDFIAGHEEQVYAVLVDSQLKLIGLESEGI